MICLGVDTSNYTTSTALYNTESGALAERRLMLPVEQGKQGLRQSDAVFLHVKQLPGLLEELLESAPPIDAVGVSVRPRDALGSYMPCFLAGELAARSIAAARGIPVRRFSHQAGHLAAAALGIGDIKLLDKPFLAFHASGGTTECLLAESVQGKCFTASVLGETNDLNAGQIIDRVGVMLGLGFPAGGELEALAADSNREQNPKPVLKEGNCCLSGLENQCRDMLQKGDSPADIARFCQASVGAAIREMATLAARKHPQLPFVFAGGVMRNKTIRTMIAEAVPQALFAPPALSSDNAAGIALLAALFLEETAC